MSFGFQVNRCDVDSRARLGRIETPHGPIDTPVFMPVGTRGTVKGLTPDQLREVGTTILLANTYHLALRPGDTVVSDLGGLHRFMGWDGPILTDSGGFQVFSLATLNSIDDDGVTFKSHIDGATVRLDPAGAMRIQENLGADIIMAFDECPKLPATESAMEQAVSRTIRWAAACKGAHQRADQALFGIVQGGLDVDVRMRCLDALAAMDFDGYAVGGLSVGEKPAEMVSLLQAFAWRMPREKPRYLMGVGRPIDIIEAVAAGIDMFDCVMPTRNGRNSWAFVESGETLRLRNARFLRDDRPLEAACDCYTCKHFGRAYLRHLFLADEMLGPMLVSLHNIAYYHRWMRRIRDAIASARFGDLLEESRSASVSDNKEDS